MIREPAVQGQFYEYGEKALFEQVGKCITFDAKKERGVKGIVSPHAGFVYSGRIAGSVYSRIKPPETFVIIGPNHTGIGNPFSIMMRGVWKMPFGEVEIDSKLAGDILMNSKYLRDDYTAHMREHSIEVQIPFIQYFAKNIQLVPITMMHYSPDGRFLDVCKDIGHAISCAIKDGRKEVVICASTDFTHYEPQMSANRKDMKAIDAILALDEKKLFDVVREEKISMCGYANVAIMLIAAKDLGATKAELTGYATSGDVTGDYSSVVGYGGLIIR